jgi:hypothetical protein
LTAQRRPELLEAARLKGLLSAQDEAFLTRSQQKSDDFQGSESSKKL